MCGYAHVPCTVAAWWHRLQLRRDRLGAVPVVDLLRRVERVVERSHVEPRRVVHSPADALAQRLLERERKLPPHRLELRAVERVPQVVARPRRRLVVHLVVELDAELLRDELRHLRESRARSDEPSHGKIPLAWIPLMATRAHLEIIEFGLALHVILLAVLAVREDEEHRGRDVTRVDVEARAGGFPARIRVERHLQTTDGAT